jgi:hypothetical protein
MKTFKILFLLSFFALSTVYAQDNDTTISCLSVNDVFILSGGSISMQPSTTIVDFQRLAPESSLLNNNFTEFNSDNERQLRGGYSFAASIGMLIRKADKTSYRRNPLLRLGIAYFSANELSATYQHQGSFTFDTLSSQTSSTVLYVDSQITERYRMKYTTQNIRLDGSLIYRTDPLRRWSIYAGFGLTAGLSMNDETTVDYRRSEDVIYRSEKVNDTYNGTSNTGVDRQHESFRNESHFVGSVYIPLGIDFTVGKTREFWKQVHLVYEMRPALTYMPIPELENFVLPTTQQMFGVRISWL